MNHPRFFRILPLAAALLLLAQPFAPALDAAEEAILRAPEPPAVPTGFTDEKQIVLAAAGGLLTLLDLNAEIPVPDSVEMIPDVEYGRVGDRPLLLDLYLPKNLDKPAPGLMFIHGGGWKNGGKKDYKYYCVRFAARGYVVVSISYRLVGEAGDWTEIDPYLTRYMSSHGLPVREMAATVRASALSAMLEMVKEGVLDLRQDDAFAPLYLRRRSARPPVLPLVSRDAP